MLIRFWFVFLLVVISEISATFFSNTNINEINQNEDAAEQQDTAIFVIEAPGGGPINDRCPCLPAMLCPRIFGSSPQDVVEFGKLPICDHQDFVRCCGVSTHFEIGQPVYLSSVAANYQENINQDSQEASSSNIEQIISKVDVGTESKSAYISSESTLENDTSSLPKVTIAENNQKSSDNVMYIYPNVMSGQISNFPQLQDGITEIRMQDEEGSDILIVFPNKESEALLEGASIVEDNFQNDDDEFVKSGSDRVQIGSEIPSRNYKYIPLTDPTEVSTKNPERRRSNVRRTTTTETTPENESKEIKMKNILNRLSTLYKQRHPTRTVTTTAPDTLINNTTSAPKQILRIHPVNNVEVTTTTATPEVIPQTFPSRQSILRNLHPESSPIVMKVNISDMMNNSTEQEEEKQSDTQENDAQSRIDRLQQMLSERFTEIQNELARKRTTETPHTTEKSEIAISHNLKNREKINPVTVDTVSTERSKYRGNRRYRKQYTSTTSLPEITSYTVRAKTRGSFKPRSQRKTTTVAPDISVTQHNSRFRNVITTAAPHASLLTIFPSRFKNIETSTVPEISVIPTFQSRFRNIQTTTSVPETTVVPTFQPRFRSTQTTTSVPEITATPEAHSSYKSDQETSNEPEASITSVPQTTLRTTQTISSVPETTETLVYQSRSRSTQTTDSIPDAPVYQPRSRSTQITTAVPEIITPAHRFRSRRTTSLPETSSTPVQNLRQRRPLTELTMSINSDVQNTRREFKPSILLSVYDSEEHETVDNREFLREGRSAFKDPSNADIQSGFMPIYDVKPIRIVGPIPKGYVEFEEDGLNLDLPDDKNKNVSFSE